MSGGIILGAIKVVGGLMAAKTAVEGIKEGNLLKAALGGVGAYMSFSGLAGAGEGGLGAESFRELGTETGEAIADGMADTAANAATDGSLGTIAEGVSSTVQDAASGLGTAASSEGTGLLETISSGAESLANTASDGLTKIGEGANNLFSGSEGGIFDKGGLLGSDYAKGQLLSGGMQLAGGYMQGNAMEDKAKWELAEARKDYEQQRARRASTADMSFLDNLQWNPQSGRFEPVSA